MTDWLCAGCGSIDPCTCITGAQFRRVGNKIEQRIKPVANDYSNRDAATFAELQEREEAIMWALDNAYKSGRMLGVHYSSARDVTEARAAALSFAVADAINRTDQEVSHG